MSTPTNVTFTRPIQTYPSLDPQDLEYYLQLTYYELIISLEDYGRIQGDETRSKGEAWMHSTEATIAGRERDAESAVLYVTEERLKLRGKIESLKEERDYLLHLLHPSIPTPPPTLPLGGPIGSHPTV